MTGSVVERSKSSGEELIESQIDALKTAGTYYVYKVDETVTFIGLCSKLGGKRMLRPGTLGQIAKDMKDGDLSVDVYFEGCGEEALCCDIADLVPGVSQVA